MLDILFGWSKASKCKKLVKKVQCRVKLLKKRRICIVKQVRQDVAHLLKHAHYDQSAAFQRVEQLVMDENMVQVYDLLDLFCEFILVNLPYICEHRECPNDNDMINEAISTLIFSSARFGELPELLPIRKLFSKHYGQRFVTVALELLPGNFVNNQIKENVYMKKVSDDVKYQLLDEISRTSCCTQQDQFMWNGEKDHTIQEDDSSSQNSSKFPEEEVMYLDDDIEEFVPPLIKDGINLQDQRLFIFRLFGQEGKVLSIKTVGILGQDQNYTRCEDKAVVVRRAISLPCEREKDCSLVDKIERSISLPCPHVHPKLPDYDELAAKFTELKRANILKQKSSELQI